MENSSEYDNGLVDSFHPSEQGFLHLLIHGMYSGVYDG